jgi:hypothetical protein
MRALWLSFVIAAAPACASHASNGLEWPKQSTSDNDGGESIAPHVARELESPSNVDEVEAQPVAAAPQAAAIVPAAATPVVSPTAPAQASEAAVEGGEIIIEVDE